MSENEKSGIMGSLGKAGGLFAGAVVGTEAASEIAHAVEPHLPGILHNQADLISDGLTAAGGFGCAYAGYVLATRKPEQALLIGAATIASGKLAGLGGQHGAALLPSPDHLPTGDEHALHHHAPVHTHLASAAHGQHQHARHAAPEIDGAQSSEPGADLLIIG